MNSHFAFILALAFVLVEGGKFSVPISQNRNEQAIRSIKKRHDVTETQKPINIDSASKFPVINVEDSSHESTPPIEKAGQWLYTTNLTLGTPPQSFRAIIELNSLDLFVPGIGCGGSHCLDHTKEKYDPSASSTFHENGTRVQKNYIAMMAYGTVDEDTLRLGELEIPGQQFVELQYYETVYPDEHILLFDSVLGLGYQGFMFDGPGTTHNILATPFRNMVDQGLLPANKFGLQLPRDEHSTGDLTFGGHNEALVSDDELVAHPLFPENTTYWQVQATSIAMTGKDCGEDVMLFNETLDNITAALWTSNPTLTLPYNLGQKVLWKIKSKTSECTYLPIVDCDAIADLPEIRLGFAGGQEIVLGGEDYTMLYEAESTPWCKRPVKECQLMVTSAPARSDFPEDLVMLGAAFLKSVYAVFDWDRRSVSFSKRES